MVNLLRGKTLSCDPVLDREVVAHQRETRDTVRTSSHQNEG